MEGTVLAGSRHSCVKRRMQEMVLENKRKREQQKDDVFVSCKVLPQKANHTIDMFSGFLTILNKNMSHSDLVK